MQTEPEIKNKIAKRERTVPEVSRGIVPRNMDDLARLCQAIARSPSSKWKNEHDVLVSVQTGMELGLTPMQALNNVPVVRGNPTIMGQMALAICRRDHAFKDGTDIEVRYAGEGKGRACYASSHKRGQHSPCAETRFGLDDAHRAGLIKGGGAWEMYPDRMLRWRAIGWHLRDNYSEHILGLYLAEEMQDTTFQPIAPDNVKALEPAPPESEDPLLSDAVVVEDPLLEASRQVDEATVQAREQLREEILTAVGGEVSAARDLLREVAGVSQVGEITSSGAVDIARGKLREHPVFGEG
jgi:hypothetical protein